jgi:hypothetical protein
MFNWLREQIFGHRYSRIEEIGDTQINNNALVDMPRRNVFRTTNSSGFTEEHYSYPLYDETREATATATTTPTTRVTTIPTDVTMVERPLNYILYDDRFYYGQCSKAMPNGKGTMYNSINMKIQDGTFVDGNLYEGIEYIYKDSEVDTIKVEKGVKSVPYTIYGDRFLSMIPSLTYS